MARRPHLVATALALGVLGVSACGPSGESRARAPRDADTITGAASAADAGRSRDRDFADAAVGCAHPERRIGEDGGLSVERRARDPADPGAGCVTLVRVDPAAWRFRILAASGHGGEPRTLPEWLKAFGETGGINTSMYLPGGKSTGILRSAEVVDRDADNPQLGAFFAFDPIDPADPPVQLVGRGCPGLDLADLRRRYRGLVQNYRLFGCDGQPIAWKDEKRFSTAGVALAKDGRVVFLHSRAPWLMADFTAWLADPAQGLGLVAGMYVEGGPEASLVVGEEVREVGSYETGFWDDSNGVFWRIPNVLTFAPR